MKYRTIAILTLLLLLISCCTIEKDIDVNDSELMLIKINKLRASGCNCGNEYIMPVKDLVKDTALEKAAFSHANDMYKYEYFSHIGLDGSAALQRAVLQGFTGNTVLENIAKGYNSIDEVLDAWKKSESHCRTLMDSSMSVIGIANQGSYWVIDLGNSKHIGF
jgi:uncharacterized protein YkwD